MSDDVRDPLATRGIPAEPGPPDAELRTFLIADVRGYTSFTQRNGDQAAAKLAAKFAVVARDVVEVHQGSVLELRGDEALCVFVSPRQAIRAAVALQLRFVEETRWDSSLPLPVGIGIDVGEAVPVEGGYRGGALNLAARLCSMAKPGEILATAEVTHLARKLDAVTYERREPMRLKGITDPVRPVRVRPEGNDPAQQLAALGALPPKPPPTPGPSWLPAPIGRHARLAVILAAVVVVAIFATLVVVGTGGGSGLSSLDEDVAAVVDATSGRLLSQLPVGSSPTGLAVVGKVAWVANTADNTVSRVDTAAGTTTTTDVGTAPVAVVAAGNGVWVANSGSGTLTRIDASGRPTLALQVGGTPSALSYDRGVLWMTDTVSGTLVRIDPATGKFAVVAHLGVSLSAVVAHGDDVWVTDSTSGDVLDFSLSSHKVVQRAHVGNDPRGLAVVGDSVWVANNLDGTVSRIDARTAAVTAALPVGDGPASVVADGDRVWVAAQDAGWLTEVDPSRARVLRHVRTGSRPVGLALQGSRLWVTAGANPALHRGGTEHAVVDDVVSLDPAVGYYDVSESVDAMLYDGLLGFRRAAGAAGSTVVPDLAVALPTVTDGGRTFEFRLRKGIAWSNGKPVTGADIRRGLERTVAAQVWPLYTGIVGASACSKSACDLSRGVVVDDAAGLVTIHLTAPDAEFDYKLALLGAVAVPATTSLAPLDDKAVLPSTGPYVVKTRTAGQTVLVRNNRFHQWSAAAQPLGYPDTLEITQHTADRLVPNRVIAAADWAVLHGTPDLAALRARFGTRVRTSPIAGTHFLALNVSVRPFDDVRVRRAVAYAIDRAAVLAAWAFPGNVACQLLPPTIPSYQPYCPYTLHPRAGTWDGPDIATAQDLVRSAGALGSSVSVWAPPALRTSFASIVRSMRTIGLDARLHVVTGSNYFGPMSRAAADGRAQAMFDGWVADYPAASNFFDTELTCRTDVARGGPNVARFCDPAYDRAVATAERLQSHDSAAAAADWARLDRMTSDLSPIVPLVTPVRINVVSARLRNVESNAGVGALLAQAWVR